MTSTAFDAEQRVSDCGYSRSRVIGPPRRFTPKVAAARKKEQSQRNAAAQSIAHRLLAKAHHDEYSALYKAAQIEVKAARGPLPGDES